MAPIEFLNADIVIIIFKYCICVAKLIYRSHSFFERSMAIALSTYKNSLDTTRDPSDSSEVCTIQNSQGSQQGTMMKIAIIMGKRCF